MRAIASVLLGVGVFVAILWWVHPLLRRFVGPRGTGPVPALTEGLPALGRVEFVDVAARAGTLVRNVCGSLGKEYILEIDGSGASFLDYDGDGWLDLFVVNGSTIERLLQADNPGNVLYRNLRNGTFQDVTGQAGVRGNAWGMGSAAADFDNDGDQDIFCANFGPNTLYRNDGNGTFTDIAIAAGVAGPPEDWSSSALWFDYDLDGDLDLYVVNYLFFDPRNLAAFNADNCDKWKGIIRGPCGPVGFRGQQDRLYRNQGDGRFADVSTAAGVWEHTVSYGLSAVAGDFDGDRYPDLYVTNDAMPNFLLRNQGDGTFSELASGAGTALGPDGRAQAGMGVDAADFDNDGSLDLVVMNFEEESLNLYRNLGGWVFGDVAAEAGLAHPSYRPLAFGSRFLDYDNDGWVDLFAANGHVYPRVEEIPGSAGPYAQTNQIFRNHGRGGYKDVSLDAGPGLLVEKVSRGVACGDYDNDGDLDVFVTNLDDVPTFLENRGGNQGAWLVLELVGTRSNRDAVGARVRVEAGGLVQVREINPYGSFSSSHDKRLHLGLGDAEQVDVLEVRWPSGQVQRFQDLPARQFLTLTEGQASPLRERSR